MGKAYPPPPPGPLESEIWQKFPARSLRNKELHIKILRNKDLARE